MPPLKVIVTGGSGTLGTYLNKELGSAFDILTLFNSNPGNCKDYSSARVDITDHGDLEKVFRENRPEIVVHCAAVSDPAAAANMPLKKVYDINVRASEKIAMLCRETGARLIYTSTDLVYDGDRGSILTEDAKLNPVSLYAETKLMGEVKIKQKTDNYVILRTALLFGFNTGDKKLHFETMYEKLKAGGSPSLFYDQYRTPLSLADAARMIKEVIEKEIPAGIYNFGGRERVSRYGTGEMLCRIAGLDKNLINRTSLEEANIKYKVKDVSLDISRLGAHGITAKTLKESMTEVLLLPGTF